ncbi:MAG: tetratricopeptide repeat protein [Chloroflexota bacterium]
MASKDKSEDQRVIIKAIIGHVKLREDFQTGTRYFENLIEHFPDEQVYYAWLADSYLAHNLPEKCLSTIDRGLSKVKEKTRLIEIKSRCLKDTGQINEAVVLLEKSIENSPTEKGLYSTLIDILSQTNPGDVEKWYRKGLSVLPEDEDLLSTYAAFLFEKGRKEEALYRYCMITRLFPMNATYAGLLGNVYLALNLNDKALGSYEKAKSLVNEPASWNFANIGNLYKNSGFYSKAIDYLNEALTIDPNDEYAHNRLATALAQQAEESKRAAELEKKGQQTFLQGDTTRQIGPSEP